MAELAIDLLVGTLAADYHIGDPNVSVNVTTGTMPGTGTFSIRMNSGAIYTVSAVSGSGPYTLTLSAVEYGTDADVVTGLIFKSVLSTRALLALIAQNSAVTTANLNPYGTFSALPGTAVEGARYTTSDSMYEFVGVAGPLWQAVYKGQSVTLPPSSSWTWDNQASAVATQTNGALNIVYGTAANRLAVYYRTAPGTPYVHTVKFRMLDWSAGSGASVPQGAGIAFRDSSGKIITFYVLNGDSGGKGLALDLWSDHATYSRSYTRALNSNSTPYEIAGAAQFATMDEIYLRQSYNGSTLTWYYSIDGVFWAQFDTRSSTDFFSSGPTQIGMVGRSDSGSGCGITQTVFDWTIT